MIDLLPLIYAFFIYDSSQMIKHCVFFSTVNHLKVSSYVFNFLNTLYIIDILHVVFDIKCARNNAIEFLRSHEVGVVIAMPFLINGNIPDMENNSSLCVTAHVCNNDVILSSVSARP
jgi:hypothetical protein